MGHGERAVGAVCEKGVSEGVEAGLEVQVCGPFLLGKIQDFFRLIDLILLERDGVAGRMAFSASEDQEYEAAKEGCVFLE